MKFSLIKNKLYKKEGDPKYVACTRVSKRLAKEQIYSQLCYASTLTEADVAAVITGLETILIQNLQLGCSVELGFLSIACSVKGGFDSPEDMQTGVFLKGKDDEIIRADEYAQSGKTTIVFKIPDTLEDGEYR